jgi:DNA polymerase-3 subunit gamma/tau
MEPRVAPEDDIPEDDDITVDDALTSHELLIRELGAQVVEEYDNPP